MIVAHVAPKSVDLYDCVKEQYPLLTPIKLETSSRHEIPGTPLTQEIVRLTVPPA